MKTILDITKGFMAASVLSVALSGCSEDVMDRINKDNDHTTDVQAKFILADIGRNIARMSLSRLRHLITRGVIFIRH